MTLPNLLNPYRSSLRLIFYRLKEAGLVDPETTVHLTLARPETESTKAHQPRQWHTDPTCTSRKVHLSLTCPVSSLLGQNRLGPDDHELCGCALQIEHLARSWGWTSVEIRAVEAWLASRIVSTGYATHEQDSAALTELVKLTPTATELEGLTGDRGQKIRQLLTDRRATLESSLWDAAKEEDDARARAAAVKAARQAQIDADRAAAEQAGVRYVPQPWGTMIDLLHEAVDLGLPLPLVVHSLQPIAYAAELAATGSDMADPRGRLTPWLMTGHPRPPRHLAKPGNYLHGHHSDEETSEGLKLFRAEVDALREQWRDQQHANLRSR